VSSQLFNMMKSELGPEEFPLAFRELAAHRGGRAFDRELLEFKYWSRRGPSPQEPGGPRGTLKLVNVEECVICGREPVQWSYYCPRCRRFVLTHPTGQSNYSFDHGVPGDVGTLVVAAWWVNAMKNALSGEEFWKVVEEMDRYLREGGEFDRDVVGFRYWRRGKRG